MAVLHSFNIVTLCKAVAVATMREGYRCNTHFASQQLLHNFCGLQSVHLTCLRVTDKQDSQ